MYRQPRVSAVDAWHGIGSTCHGMAWHRTDTPWVSVFDSWHGIASPCIERGAARRVGIHMNLPGMTFAQQAKKFDPPNSEIRTWIPRKKHFKQKIWGSSSVGNACRLRDTKYCSHIAPNTLLKDTLLRTTRRRSGPCSVFYYIVYFYLCTGKVGLKNSWTRS